MLNINVFVCLGGPIYSCTFFREIRLNGWPKETLTNWEASGMTWGHTKEHWRKWIFYSLLILSSLSWNLKGAQSYCEKNINSFEFFSSWAFVLHNYVSYLSSVLHHTSNEGQFCESSLSLSVQNFWDLRQI